MGSSTTLVRRAQSWAVRSISVQVVSFPSPPQRLASGCPWATPVPLSLTVPTVFLDVTLVVGLRSVCNPSPPHVLLSICWMMSSCWALCHSSTFMLWSSQLEWSWIFSVSPFLISPWKSKCPSTWWTQFLPYCLCHLLICPQHPVCRMLSKGHCAGCVSPPSHRTMRLGGDCPYLPALMCSTNVVGDPIGWGQFGESLSKWKSVSTYSCTLSKFNTSDTYEFLLCDTKSLLAPIRFVDQRLSESLVTSFNSSFNF